VEQPPCVTSPPNTAWDMGQAVRHSGWRRMWSKALTHDFFPDWSARVRRALYHPLGVLVLAAVVAFLCGLFLHAQGFILCGVLVAIISLGLSWPWLSLRGLQGWLHFESPRAVEGESVGIQVSLRNRLPWPVLGVVLKGGFGEDSQQSWAAMASVPPRRTALYRRSFTTACRGIYPRGAVEAGTAFPFGFWECRRSLWAESSLIVWPRTFPVGPVPLGGGEQQVEGNVSRSKVGSGGDVLGVRPYRRGDSLRRIHWGQSARHDRLIVCELESPSRPIIQLVLDVDERVHVGSGPNSSREWAIRIAASFAQGWLEAGAQVGLIWDSHDIPPASGQAQKIRILDSLASIPEGCQTPLSAVLNCPKCRRFREGLLIVITTDRMEGEPLCLACEAEHYRWVILSCSAFAESGEVPSSRLRNLGVTPWLYLDAIEAIPSALRGGWREAQHGS